MVSVSLSVSGVLVERLVFVAVLYACHLCFLTWEAACDGWSVRCWWM